MSSQLSSQGLFLLAVVTVVLISLSLLLLLFLLLLLDVLSSVNESCSNKRQYELDILLCDLISGNSKLICSCTVLCVYVYFDQIRQTGVVSIDK